MRSQLLLSMVVLGVMPLVMGQGLTPSTPQVPLPVATRPAAGVVGPQLVIEDADPAARTAVHLDAVKLHVTLNAPLAETTVTLTFKNTLGRQLEGTLEFPLPENAAVVGYALDVPAGSGTLVEGVCVEKERARRIFETEQRRGVDPGLVEQTRGNNYRTRVHSIPAGGTRTVQITYVSDMYDMALQRGIGGVTREIAYSMPMDFAGTLSAAEIEVEVVGQEKPESLRINGLEGLAFKPSESSKYPAAVAKKTFGTIKLGGNLTVTMPAADDFARVERRVKPRSVENLLEKKEVAGETYFLISGVITTDVQTNRPPLAHIGIIWDTSLSRANADRSAELAMLREIAGRQPNATFHVFGTDGTAIKELPAKEVEALVKFLADVPCDGALKIDGLNRKLGADRLKDTTAAQPEIYLFFSDGLVTLGPRELGPADAPIFTVSSDPRADLPLLKAMAEGHRGRYLNLQRLSAKGAVAAILEPMVPVVLTWDQDKVIIDDLYPKGVLSVPAGQRITFTGRLLAPAAKVQLNGREIQLTQEGASTTGIVPRFWAQQKAAALQMDVARRGDELLALGKDFNIVTSQTSLLVLETVDQYVRNRVVPPQSAKELYDGFIERIEKESNLAKVEEQKKIDHVLELWNKRVEWWNKEFTPPTRQQLAALAAKTAATAPGDAARGTGGLFGTRADTATTDAPAQTIAPTTPVPAAEAAGRNLSASYAMRLEAGKSAGESEGRDATISIKAWSPDTPYLRALAEAQKTGRTPQQLYALYLEQRKGYVASPSFYLDCGNFFLEQKQRERGVRILTNIAQLHLEDAALLRVAAYRLLQIGEYALAIDLFEQAKALRPDEPQSWRDLALALTNQGDLSLGYSTNHVEPAQVSASYLPWQRALELYHHVVMNEWDRFDEIEVIALMEANELWAKIQKARELEGTLAPQITHIRNPFDPRLVKNLDCDLRILLTWDADNTDIDLHVLEPSTEEAYYSHNLTLSGGMVSRDFTQGYGPEEYVIHHAPKGPYKIMANYYGSQQQTVQGPVTVQATVITNFGRPDEKRESLTLRLTDKKESQTIGEVQFAK